jgi:hypothetical protein
MCNIQFIWDYTIPEDIPEEEEDIFIDKAVIT